jgi:hypothetical protein
VQKMAFLCSATRLAFTAIVNSIGNSAHTRRPAHMTKARGQTP